MAVHGRFGEPCPRCGEKIQRIRYADNETNYCAKCQTGGKLLADSSLSRLLGCGWQRSMEKLEALKRNDASSSLYKNCHPERSSAAFCAAESKDLRCRRQEKTFVAFKKIVILSGGAPLLRAGVEGSAFRPQR